MTRAYADVIGDPISHSKSPLIHNFWLEKLGIDAEYRTCHVRADELADYFARRRGDAEWRGCNVTLPHKESVSKLADIVVLSRAEEIGAVNTVTWKGGGALGGHNTDVDGIDQALQGVELAGAKVCVMGAGGAARAAFHLLAEKKCEIIGLARSPAKAEQAGSECGASVAGFPFQAGSGALQGADVLINATQLGMVGQEPMPAFVLDELRVLAKDALVFDMVYAPLDTALLHAARALRLRTSDGLTMLIGQAAAAFECFFGHPAPRQYDAELRALLIA